MKLFNVTLNYNRINAAYPFILFSSAFHFTTLNYTAVALQSVRVDPLQMLTIEDVLLDVVSLSVCPLYLLFLRGSSIPQQTLRNKVSIDQTNTKEHDKGCDNQYSFEDQYKEELCRLVNT